MTQHAPIDNLSIIKTVRPLVYNFFCNQQPQPFLNTLDQLDITNYKYFHSQRLERSNNFFKPTIQSKKLMEEPKFLLSLERKKIKIINGISQRAMSEKPSRNSYRAGKKRTNTSKNLNAEQINNSQQANKVSNYKKSIEDNLKGLSAKKIRQPHLHFNLQYVLNQRKSFNTQFIREENIQGCNYPYFSYFSSDKSPMPKTHRSSRESGTQQAKAQDKLRYIATSIGIRPHTNR